MERGVTEHMTDYEENYYPSYEEAPEEDVDEQDPISKEIMCKGCGQLTDVPEYDAKLWDTYNRIKDGRSHYEALVYDSQWLQENVHDEEDHDAVMHSMEKDMVNRGLCPSCGRPDLRNVKPEDILSEEDAESCQDIWAI
jgi:hypothetical protein